MIEILIVEDNDSEILLLKRALSKGKVRCEIHIATDGEEALDFLFRRNGYGDAHRPDLIMLDLNLPKIDGREVLSEVKANSDLKSIPVIVFSSSSADKDIIESYKLQANSYITKPVDYLEFLETIRKIEEFWFEIVKLPPSTKPS